jgi:hypothetical protein
VFVVLIAGRIHGLLSPLRSMDLSCGILGQSLGFSAGDAMSEDGSGVFGNDPQTTEVGAS